MSVALLFSPQGSQAVGMGRALAETSPAAGEVFSEADATLGWSVSSLCWEGPQAALDETRQTQPCLVTTAVACLAALREAMPDLRPAFVAGHSVGEYAALVAGGGLSLVDALRLVARRAELMSATGDGGMLAVIGLSRREVAGVLDSLETPERVVVANDNAPGQVVISGPASGLEAAADGLRAAGAKRVIRLRVSGAFHSPPMRPVGERLARAFDEATWHDASPPLISNVTAAPVSDAAQLRELLARQVSSAVEWVASVQRMSDEGVDHFIECGPGNALSGMVRRIAPRAQTANVSDPATLAATLETLRGARAEASV